MIPLLLLLAAAAPATVPARPPLIRPR
ncbi:MAG: hypothetical protein K0Q72_2663, partial [Armatimonadetes bacterium]|nr:hypothetical protein [Armatimonadota bacterium]